MYESLLSNMLAIVVILPLLASLISFVNNKNKIACITGVITSILTTAISGVLLYHAVHSNQVISYVIGGWQKELGIEMLLTPLNALMLFLVHIAYCCSCLFAKDHFKNDGICNFYILLAVFVCGASGMSLSNDAFNIFVFMEVASISAYALVSLGNGKGAAIAAFEYLIIGSVGASFYLLGVAILYMDTGFLNLTLLRMSSKGVNAATLSSVFILTGLAIKTASFPLHAWLVKAYRFAPPSFNMCSGAVLTKVFALIIIKTFIQMFSLTNMPADLVLYMGMASMLFGALAAYRSNDVRYIIANSSISQVGYIISGFAMKTASTIEASVIGTVGHSFTQIALFAATGIAMNMAKEESKDLNLSSLKQQPIYITIAVVILLASIVGIPSTAGFLTKWLLMRSALEYERWPLLVCMLISSALAVGYCSKVATQMLSTGPTKIIPVKLSWGGPIIIISAAIVLITGIYINPLHQVSRGVFLSLRIFVT